MTEADWWAATDAVALTEWLFFDARVADRKLRLFCVACCRWTEGDASSDVFRGLIRTVERFADAEVTEEELDASLQPAKEIIAGYSDNLIWSAQAQSERMITTAAFTPTRLEAFLGPGWRERSWYQDCDPNGDPYPVTVVYLARAPFGHERATREPEVVRLLRDLFGPLLFRDVAVTPAWLTTDGLALARAMYDNRDFSAMPILADALQDAGCDNTELLDHCRGPGPHVRGCWVVDLVLGK
jgi:hypothetical protein